MVLIATSPLPAADRDDQSSPAFGGPDAVGNLVQEREVKPDLRERLKKEHGLDMGVDYSAVYLQASDSLEDDDDAAGGMLRFFGTWDVVGRGTKSNGGVTWKVEHRHAYTDLAPADLEFATGAVGLITPPFSDEGGRVTNLYWKQRFNEGRSTAIAGFLDVTDYVDVYALASPWTGFLNFAFSTGTTTIPLPNDATFGAALGSMLGEQTFLIAGITDTNSDPTDLSETVDSFFNDNEYFYSLELGVTQSQERIYLDNYHVTLWSVDEREEANTPDGWGINVSFSRLFKDQWMPFLRAGWAEDGGSLMQKSISGGTGYLNLFKENDQLGAGLNWGEVNESSFGSGLDDQITAEIYYRWPFGDQFALTPTAQWIQDPPNNPDESSIFFWGVRGRFVF
jgi:porin